MQFIGTEVAGVQTGETAAFAVAVQEDGVVLVAVMDGFHAVPQGLLAGRVAAPVPDVVVKAVVVDMGDDLRRSLVVGFVDSLLVGAGIAVRSAVADADDHAVAETTGSRVAAGAASEDLDVANVRIDEAEGGPLAFADGGLQSPTAAFRSVYRFALDVYIR